MRIKNLHPKAGELSHCRLATSEAERMAEATHAGDVCSQFAGEFENVEISFSMHFWRASFEFCDVVVHSNETSVRAGEVGWTCRVIVVSGPRGWDARPGITSRAASDLAECIQAAAKLAERIQAALNIYAAIKMGNPAGAQPRELRCGHVVGGEFHVGLAKRIARLNKTIDV